MFLVKFVVAVKCSKLRICTFLNHPDALSKLVTLHVRTNYTNISKYFKKYPNCPLKKHKTNKCIKLGRHLPEHQKAYTTIS